MAHTLTDLILLARQSADMEGDPLCDDTEVTQYLNDGRAKLYREYIKVCNDAYLMSASVTVASGANTAPLPADFFQSRGLDVYLNNRWVPVDHFTWRERGTYRTGRRSHRIDTVIRLEPTTEDVSGSYRLWYYPTPAQFAAGTDPLDSIEEAYFSFLVDYAAWRMLIKAKLDSTEQQKGMALVIGSIAADNTRRDDEPDQAPDVEAQDGLSSEWGF